MSSLFQDFEVLSVQTFLSQKNKICDMRVLNLLSSQGDAKNVNEKFFFFSEYK